MVNRIIYYLLTNFAIIFILNITMGLLGIDSYLESTGKDLSGLLVYAMLFGMMGSFVSLAMSKSVSKRLSGAKVIKVPANSKEFWLISTVKKQAKSAGIGVPELAVFDSNELNAFATGMNQNNALIAVSSGLLENMSQAETEAVIGHEISHISNRDMITVALIQGVVNTFVMFFSRIIGQWIDKAIFKNERNHGIGFWTTTIFSELLLGILSSMIVMYFSRQREFRADLGGAKLAGKHKMIAVLKRFRVQCGGQTKLTDQLAVFGISGSGSLGIKQFFMSHPRLDERIKALKNN